MQPTTKTSGLPCVDYPSKWPAKKYSEIEINFFKYYYLFLCEEKVYNFLAIGLLKSDDAMT